MKQLRAVIKYNEDLYTDAWHDMDCYDEYYHRINNCLKNKETLILEKEGRTLFLPYGVLNNSVISIEIKEK